MKFSALVATTALAAAAMLPEQVDAHAFLLLPKADIVIPEKNFYAYVVPGEKVPPFSSYTTGDAERNSIGFTANYKKLAPASLKEFILKNQVRATGDTNKPGGTPECGYSNPNEPPQPLPDHIEFGNYNLQNPSGLHPGPCEAWCDDEIVVPFTEDCRKLFQKPIPYAKDKCVGKSRFTFYWLATHFAPFQVYIGCAPLQGAKAGGGGGAASPKPSAGNATTPATVKPSPAATPKPVAPAPGPAPPAPAASKAPAPASTPEPAVAPEASPKKCGVKRN